MDIFKVGDRVRVKEREQTTKDIKENAYFPHLSGLTGVVSKIYSPEEICVTIERESLPEKNSTRHAEIETALQDKWLDSLSQDARGKLTDREKEFHLHYTILMNSADLEPMKGSRSTKPKDPALKTKDLDAAEDEYLRNRTV